MVNKLTAAVVLLGATFCSIPVYAEISSPSTLQPAAGAADARAALKPADGLPVSADLKPAADLQVPADPATTDVDKLNPKFLKSFVLDTGKVVTSPLRWDKKDWLKVGLVLGATGSLMLVDKKIKDFAQDHQNGAFSKFAMVGNDFGNAIYVLPLVGAAYGYGAIADDHKARRASLLALESYAISGMMTEGLKTLGGRHRPNTGDSPTTWDGPHLFAKNVSFNSGHTASAFSIATVFASEYKDNAWVPPIAYGLATLTGLSRIYSNEHWASDVFFGGALGYFTSKLVLSLHKEEDKNFFTNRLTIMPQVGKEMTGLSVKYNF